MFLYDVWTNNPVIRAFRDRDPASYSIHFLEGDHHWGYQSRAENHAGFVRASFEARSSIGLESTPLMGPSVYEKFDD